MKQTPAQEVNRRGFISPASISFIAGLVFVGGSTLSVALEPPSVNSVHSELLWLALDFWREKALPAVGIATVSGWISLALTIAYDAEDPGIPIGTLAFSALLTPLYLAVPWSGGQAPSTPLRLTLALWILVTLVCTWEEIEFEDLSVQAIRILVACWAMAASVLMVVGANSSYNVVVGLIVLATIGALTLAVACTKVSRDQPDPPTQLRPWRLNLRGERGVASLVLNPMTIVADYFLRALHPIANVLWVAGRYVARFFVQVGKVSAEFLAWEVLERPFLVRLAKMVTAFFCSCSSLLIVEFSIDYFKSYLKSSEWNEQAPALIFLTLLTFCLLFIIWLTSALLASLSDGGLSAAANKSRSAVVAALGWISINFFVAGLALHGINRMWVQVPGFSKIGIFSAAIILMLLVGISQSLWSHFKKKSTHPT